MAKQSDRSASPFEAEEAGGLLSGLFAEENELDRRALLRIGTWGVTAVGAIALAVMSNQWSLGLRRDQVAAADLGRQAQQIQSLASEDQSERRRLASAIDTLNNDRDRLFSRVTVLEQGLDSVTGALARQTTPPFASPAPQPAKGPQAANSPAAVATPDARQPPPQTATVAPAPAPVAAAPASGSDKTVGSKPARAEPIAANVPTGSAVVVAAQAPAAPIASPSPAAAPASAASLMAKSILAPPLAGGLKLIEPLQPIEADARDEKPAEAKVADARGADRLARLKAAPVASTASSAPSAASPAPPAASPETAAAAAASPPEENEANPATASVQRTEFAVDLGSANTLGGLRAIWRSMRHRNSDLAELGPIIVVKEGPHGLGTQLHLAAGPLKDAAAAAKICAALAETKRGCEPTVYDGQRLAMTEEEPKPLPSTGAESEAAARSDPGTKSNASRHGRHARKDEPPPPAAQPAKPEQSSSVFSSIFGRK